MAEDKFSSSLEDFSGEIENSALRDSLSFLKDKLGDKFVVKKWSDHQIAVPISITVDIPSLGPYQGIDIQPIEPVIIVFNILHYPTNAPIVFTDRLDFPKDKLAHLYIAVQGRPPAFCYVRGSMNEWYANKRINDLLTRISNWLRDAATGELSTDGSQFEPLRLEGYSGTNTYDYDLLAEIVTKNKSLFGKENWTLGLFERISDGETISFKLNTILSSENYKSVFEEFAKEQKKDENAPDKKYYHYGYIIWSDQSDHFDTYEVDLPRTWNDFMEFCKRYSIDLSSFEKMISTTDGNIYVSTPVIVGIKRPAQLIGFSSNIEFVNFRFLVDTQDVEDGKIVNNIPIKIQSHNQPITLAKAQIISGSRIDFSGRSVVFGCGALGSKIVLHLGRSGLASKFTLIDPDNLSPHNMVRHGLLAGDVAKNKAFALQTALKQMFNNGTNLPIISGPAFKDEAFSQADTFKIYERVFDFTASESFFNKLVSTKSMDSLQVTRATISDFGNIGVMLNEGAKRNPRIDDLQAALFSMYKSEPFIQQWLVREGEAAATGNLVVQVGIGCNSETTVLSDEKVSMHSAFFAGTIKHQLKKPVGEGQIVLHGISEDEHFDITTKTILIDPFDIIPAINNTTWSIRFKSGILQQISKEAIKARRKETGGVFIGIINYKTKTIHVVDVVAAPPDSKASPVCFYRGYRGLPEQINKIVAESGGQLGYIGEWHSHPMGPNGLSDVDMASVARFKSEFADLTTPLPVFLTVVTPAGILPHVF